MKTQFSAMYVHLCWFWISYRTLLNRVKAGIQPTLNTVSGTGQEYLFSFWQLVYAAVLDQLYLAGFRDDGKGENFRINLWGFSDDRFSGQPYKFIRTLDYGGHHQALIDHMARYNFECYLDVTMRYLSQWSKQRGRKRASLYCIISCFPVIPGIEPNLKEGPASFSIHEDGLGGKVFTRTRIYVNDLCLHAKMTLGV